MFNLAILDRQNSEQSRYPFHLHVQKKWSLEHIHAQNERALKDADIDNLKKHYPQETSLDGLNRALVGDSGMNIELNDGEYRLIYSDKIGEFGESVILTGKDMLDSLNNLALLGREENSALNDKMYLEKKTLLSEWERSTDKRFIPIGTRMAFFKHFSPESTLPLAWTVLDGTTYLDTISNLINGYIKPVTLTASNS